MKIIIGWEKTEHIPALHCFKGEKKSLDYYKTACQRDASWVKEYQFFASSKLTEEEKNSEVSLQLNSLRGEIALPK